jgi:hypothetical protein
VRTESLCADNADTMQRQENKNISLIFIVCKITDGALPYQQIAHKDFNAALLNKD